MKNYRKNKLILKKLRYNNSVKKCNYYPFYRSSIPTATGTVALAAKRDLPNSNMYQCDNSNTFIRNSNDNQLKLVYVHDKDSLSSYCSIIWNRF